MQLEKNGGVKTIIYTCDRKENYLKATLEHMAKAGVKNICISDNIVHMSGQGANMREALDVLSDLNVLYNIISSKKSDDVRVRAQTNYINALRLNHSKGTNKFRLILEDDVQASIEMESVLDKYISAVREQEGNRPFILSLYTPYVPLQDSLGVVKIDVDGFYGLQACLFSESICGLFGNFIFDRIGSKPHDFLIKDFCKENGINIWAVSHSLFQHIGVKTTGLGHHHTANNFYDDVFGENKKNAASFDSLPARTDKKRVLICGEYLCRTGFATVSKNLAKILKDQYEVVVVDFTHSNRQTVIEDINIMGNLNGDDYFGVERILSISDDVDAILIINDVWYIDKMLEKIKISGKKTPPIIVYFPVDAINHSAHWYKHFDIVTEAVTYTNFAKGVVVEAAKEFVNTEHSEALIKKLSIIPHGADDKIYYPIQDRIEVRRKLFKSDKFDNSFIILNANRNQPRKKLDVTMGAFAMFMEQNPESDAYLYMHSAIIDKSINLYQLAKQLGILSNVIFSVPIDQPTRRPNASDEEMNLIYNACDVGINTSMGEGWGLVSVEHAMTGAVQIVPDHSACKEIFTDAEAMFIMNAEDYMFDHIMTIGSLPSLYSTYECIQKLHADPILCVDKSRLTRAKFSNKEAWSWEGLVKDSWLEIVSMAMAKNG